MFGITERDLILSMGLFLLIRLDSISLDHSVPILLDHYIYYMLEVTKLLINGGIDINALDKYKVIPLKYAITITKLPSNELKPIYEIFLKHGSNYKNIDVFGKTCLDYVKELSWRNDVIKIIKEFEDGNKK